MRLALVLIPVGMAMAVAIVLRVKPDAPTTLSVQPVQVEGIRAQRIDADSFERRWSQVNQLAPAIVVVRLPNGTEGEDARSATQAQPRRLRAQPSSLRTDVCARHGMRREYYSKGGWKYWRCRRR